jgi:anti-sigma factor RsiW
MPCSAYRVRISAYIDGELPPSEMTEVADHLAHCPACSRDYEGLRRATIALQERLVRHRTPDVLRARIRSALLDHVSDDPVAVPAPSRRHAGWWRQAVAAVVIIAASSATTVLLTRSHQVPNAAIADEILASHIRSLMPGHLTDITSNDQHNVKPWFNGRVDFSPPVPRLDDNGFRLIGGRLDFVGGRPVAVVVYGRRQHLINVFSWPAVGDREVPMTERRGYNLLTWQHDGVATWVVSDLNQAELRQFVGLFRGVSPPPSGN